MQYGVPPEQRGQKGRKFIGVICEFCGLYTRVYYNEKENGYYGYCPMCHRRIRVKVDPDTGTDGRFFRLKT